MIETATNTHFPSVIGQDEPKRLILSSIASGRLAHAYLLVGPSGVGKMAFAIELARILNCRLSPEESADTMCTCTSCQQMRAWRHPHLSTLFPLPNPKKKDGDSGDGEGSGEEKVRAALEDILTQYAATPYVSVKYTGSGQIAVWQIRELRNLLALSSDSQGVRVTIIHPADQLNPSAANAFLKHLEEPPDRSLFILIVSSTRDLLPTIVSRCQQIRFSPLSAEEIARALRIRLGQSPDIAEQTAALAGGSFTRAVELSSDTTTKMLQESLEFLRFAAVGNVAKLSETIGKWLAESAKGELKDRLDFTRLWVEDALVAKAYGIDATSHLTIRNSREVAERMGKYPTDKLERAMTALEEASLSLESNTLPSIALTALAVRLKRIFV